MPKEETKKREGGFLEKTQCLQFQSFYLLLHGSFFFFFQVVSLHVLMMIEFNKNITVQKRQIRNLHSSQKLICE